jgi:hypothetical protein
MRLLFNQILHNSRRFVRELRTSTSPRPTYTYVERNERESEQEAGVVGWRRGEGAPARVPSWGVVAGRPRLARLTGVHLRGRA